MGFSGRREALTDLAFATFGDPATWAGIPVTVRPKSRNEDDRFGQVQVVTTSTILRVRRSEVADPKPGDIVVVGAGRLAGRYQVKRGAMLDGRGVWDCPVDGLA